MDCRPLAEKILAAAPALRETESVDGLAAKLRLTAKVYLRWPEAAAPEPRRAGSPGR